MNRKEFFKVSAAASLASLLSPLSAYAEKFESEGKKVKVAVIGCGSVSTQYFSPYIEVPVCRNRSLLRYQTGSCSKGGQAI